MPAIDGGIIKKVIPFPRAGRRLAVLGVWSGGSWTPSTQAAVRQYRGNTIVGVWKMVGVDYPSRQHADAVVLLEPQGQAISPDIGDILVFGQGVFSQWPVEKSALVLESDAAVEVGNQRYHGIARVRESRIESILLFHQADAAIDSTPMQPIWRKGEQFFVELKSSSFEDMSRYLIQLTLNGKYVSLQKLLTTLQPLRSFVLDSGQEMLFQIQRTTSGPRLALTYDYFEPFITASEGSVKLFVHPSQPTQLPMYIHPEDPLKLFVQVLDGAFRHSIVDTTGPLLERVFSVDELLRKIYQFADRGSRHGELTIHAPGLVREIVIVQHVVEVVRASIQTLETRRLRRTGVLYGVDLVRNWCRILVEQETSSQEPSSEDWTIRFQEPLKGTVSGTIPRRVLVEFDTQTRPGMKRGTGILLSLENGSEES